MVPDIAERIAEVVDVCRHRGVTKLWLFGSATGRGDREFRAESDVDLLAEFGPVPEQGWNHPLFTLPETLETIVGRRVHLTENRSFRNPHFRDEVLRTRELLYDASREPMPV